jgi:5'-3' exonuclease
MENVTDTLSKKLNTKLSLDDYSTIYLKGDIPVLFVDMSYYIFYRFFALCSWWKRAQEEELDVENILDNQIFMEKYHKLFIENIKKIIKKYKLQDSEIIFAKDCKRYNIWRNSYYERYKGTRDDKNKKFNKNIFIYTYDKIVPDLLDLDIKIIEVDNAEADDVIAVLKTNIRDKYNELPIYIITNDHDYLQLFDDNTFIYNLKGLNLRTKSRGNSKLDLQFKIFRGDISDNIMPVITKKIRDDKIIDMIYNKELFDNFFDTNKELLELYKMNELLIDFKKIPINIQNNIQKYIKFI